MIPILQPLVAVGSFEFVTPIKRYVEQFPFIHEVEQDDDYEVYSLETPLVEIYVEEGRIESVVCREECLYKGMNIIGMSIDQFISNYDAEYFGEIDELDFEEDDTPQYVYDFDSLGLLIWVKNDLIITVTASKRMEEPARSDL